ncbi:MAG: hypothetical protein WB710_14420 [Stellaceae bacterium]
MSVTPNNLVAYGSVNMPEADGVIVGGAVDLTISVAFYDISPSGAVDWVSSSASDTATKAQITGRDTTGAIQTPAAITLNGRTPVTGSQTFERLLYGIITGAVAGSFPLANPGGTPAVGDVACFAHAATISGHTAQAGSANTSGTTPPLFKLQAGDGASVSAGMIIRLTGGTDQYEIRQIVATSGYGADVVAVNRDWTTVPDATTTYNVNEGMLFPISPNAVTKVTRCFATAAADVPTGSARYFFEKVFAVNNNTATALTGAQIEIASETPSLPSGALLDIGLCTAMNDTNSCNPRQQASSFVPTGCGAFVTQPALISVPSPGNLPSGATPNIAGAQGVWLRLTLPAGTAAYKGAADLRVQGTTT